MSTTSIATAADGCRLLLRSWEPAGHPPRAVILIVHGLGEHSGRYEHVGGHLAQQGFLVRALDLRGFGGSEGPRAYVAGFDVYLDDLEPHVAQAAGHGVPVIMLGHSLGGLLALLYAQERTGLDLLVLSSPVMEAAIPRVKQIAARALRRIAPRFALPNNIDGAQLSRDPAVGEAYFADPLVCTRTTAMLGAGLLDAMAAARAGEVPLPTLVIHGAEDTLVPVEASASLDAFPTVQRVVFDEFRHETFNEDGGIAALATVTNWIEARLG
jgi:alpha-beta hydrolase superfamily lysophospholipase